MLKTEQYFHMWFFIFENQFFLAIIATIGFSRPQTPEFKNKKSLIKNFNILVIFQLILNVLTLNFLKLV